MGQLSNPGNIMSSNSGSFPDPFADVASLAMPETMQLMLRWCEYIFLKLGTYRQAVERVISYFITDVEVDDDEDSDNKEKYETFLRETLGIYKALHTVALDYMCYGNSFVSVNFPFRRWLFCKKCFFEAPIKVVMNNEAFAFKWSGFEFNAKCPKCHCSGVWGKQDRRETNEENIKVKRWNPHEMDILFDVLSETSSFIWKIPEDYRAQVRRGDHHVLESANWEVVQAIKNGLNLKFDKDVIFHFKEETLAGVRNKGWGISKVMCNFGQAWYVQVLRRFNEAIALDYVIPFRVLTPVPGPGGGENVGAKDPLFNMGLGNFAGKVNTMLRNHRRDPATWHVLPFPVQYNAIGGDATKLAPRELLDQGLEILLNDIGVPTELYKGSLQIQTAPAALRLFESNWTPFIYQLNALLRFIVNRVSHLLNWKPVKAKLMRVTHADDLNKQQAMLQLMMGKQISPTTALKSIDIDYKTEIKKILEDQLAESEQQQKMQEKVDKSTQMSQMAQDPQQQQQGGGQGQPGQAAPNPSASMPTNPNEKITPQELIQKAQSIATQMLALPESQKDSQLRSLKQTDSVLHDLVVSQMDAIRQQARSQGGAQVMQQQFPPGGAGQKPQ